MTNLESLAATISSRAADITRMLKKESKPVPSFAESSYNDYASGDEELRIARNQLIDAAKDAIRLAQGPEDHILDLGWSVRETTPFSIFELTSNMTSTIHPDCRRL